MGLSLAPDTRNTETHRHIQEQDRYTSYHSDKTFSLLDWVYKYVKEGTGGGMFGFTSGGSNYLFVFNPYIQPAGLGQIFTYVPNTAEPKWVMKDDAKVVVEFTRDTFDSFIETFYLDGRLLEEILASQITSPQNYTLYHHPERTFAVRSEARDTFPNHPIFFGYNGIHYELNYKEFIVYGLKQRYLSPYLVGGWKTLIEFKPVEFPQFIKTFEIEGKTVEWVLDHQRTWKYQCPFSHLERVSWEHFFFTYKRKKYMYFLYDRYAKKYDWPDGYYFTIVDKISTNIGPFEESSDMLKKIYIDHKSLKDLFDNEYDDDIEGLKASYADWWWMEESKKAE